MAKKHTRKAVILTSLLGVLTVTSGLLMAVAPEPLRPGLSTTLFNKETVPSDLAPVLQTDRPLAAARWTRILIRDSRTPSGNAQTLAHPTAGVGDHFVLCNGRGGADGEIQISARWANQSSALPPAGLDQTDTTRWISICVVGQPGKRTPAQTLRLQQLVDTLCKQWSIAPEQVMTIR
jgi:hypothetical protein